MGQAQRRREDGLHKQQGRDQAREEGGGVFHGVVLNPAGGGCQGLPNLLRKLHLDSYRHR
jgi:hypothetical protein